MLFELTVTQFSKMLRNLSLIIDKSVQHAEAKKFDSSVLVQSRLAPDQFAFARQIQIACDTAKRCAAQLGNKEAPTQADDETTMAQLKARVESVITYLGTFSARDFSEASSRKVSQPRWEGQHLTGEEYALQHAVPNFYFHLTTAYAILRHNGVDVGKKDYLGAMPLKK